LASIIASVLGLPQSVDQRLIVSFARHPDDRLGAGRSEQEPAAIAEPRGRLGDRLRHRRMLERLRRSVSDVPTAPFFGGAAG
jgi:hypothetical protein